MIKRIVSVLLAGLLLSFAAFAEVSDSPAVECARAVLEAFDAGDYPAIVEMLNADARAAVNADMIQQAWDIQLAQLGELQGVESISEQVSGNQRYAVFLLRHVNGAQALTVGLDQDNLISTLQISPYIETKDAVERALPDGVEELGTTLFDGTERELSAAIVRPIGADEHTPYVILIQGSGTSDMDETIGPNKPFRDLSYDLAVLGIGSLRFDKMPYAHPEFDYSTAESEYLEPVLEALSVLREETGATHIYAAGHSQGGILTPWLISESGEDGFAGGIVLAGTPKQLWEISYQQNLTVIESLSEAQQAVSLEQVDAERARAESLAEMSDEEARGNTVFGISAYYLKHMGSLDEIALAQSIERPLLFLWGEQDFQVIREDYEAWQDALGEGALYTYITYPELNHLFMPAEEGDSILNASAAYARAAAVDNRVSVDIAGWIRAQLS